MILSEHRIVSLLPAATEMVCELDLADQLVGITHECNWPPEIKDREIVVSSLLNTRDMAPKDIDELIAKRIGEGKELYLLDEEKLKALKPTLILAQDMCQVCAASGRELWQILEKWDEKPEVLWMSPNTLTEVAQCMRELGDATGKEAEAEVKLIAWKARVDEVQHRVSTKVRVRCFIMEWADPIYCSGHWVAEMVQMAGGVDLLARPGQDSVRIEWEEVRAAAPDVLIIAPCGYNLDESSHQLDYLQTLPGWSDLPAVKQRRVYAINADAFMTRPGPRLVDGIEMLAYLLHGRP